MNERERWVVYPLLFLALGAALRDKLVDRTTTKSIICEELIVVDQQPLGNEPRLLARIGRSEAQDPNVASGGQLMLNGEFTVVDLGPPAPNQLVKTLVRVGRTGKPKVSKGYLWVDGEAVINGPLNAMQYVYRGMPIIPALRAVIPGLPNLLRVFPEAGAPQQQSAAPQGAAPQTPPPASPPGEADDAEEDSRGDAEVPK